MAGKCSHKEIAKVAGVSLTAVKEFNRKQQAEIEGQVRANLGKVAVECLQNMVDLAFTAENEHVRFVATKTYWIGQVSNQNRKSILSKR